MRFRELRFLCIIVETNIIFAKIKINYKVAFVIYLLITTFNTLLVASLSGIGVAVAHRLPELNFNVSNVAWDSALVEITFSAESVIHKKQ